MMAALADSQALNNLLMLHHDSLKLLGQAFIHAVKATRILDTQRAITMMVTMLAGLFGGSHGGRGCAVQLILQKPTIHSLSA
ncbi:MAG: hypothetical protein KJO70_01485 [Gammaproteobacteria bacterium]|nr:hypothetical protein [Gammaproteobacteria bacterium]MBT8049841.1 hypothetical protein [Gammaproteobacteria bacterium]NNJ78594.1 hypothetical protein [Xanthomonadales bacterium]